MANYGHIIFYSLIGGLFSLLGGVILLRREKTAQAMVRYATPFAAGSLLAAVFLDLLKDGVEEAPSDSVMYAALIGVLLFFIAERFLRWFHHHHVHQGETDPSLSLIITGDTIHNALDGIAIATSFMISVPTGIVTTIAIAAHEIPQEIGDFGLMLHKGLSRSKVLLVNVMSALATTVMAVVTFAVGNEKALPIGTLIGLSAGFLLYIAMSDIIPEIHEHTDDRRLVSWQPVLLLLGAIIVTVFIQMAHAFVDPGHK